MPIVCWPFNSTLRCHWSSWSPKMVLAEDELETTMASVGWLKPEEGWGEEGRSTAKVGRIGIESSNPFPRIGLGSKSKWQWRKCHDVVLSTPGELRADRGKGGKPASRTGNSFYHYSSLLLFCVVMPTERDSSAELVESSDEQYSLRQKRNRTSRLLVSQTAP